MIECNPFNPNDYAFPINDAGSISTQNGLTIRDYFAAKAMQGDWAAQNNLTGEYTNSMSGEQLMERARTFYRMADAMLAQRDK
jgi:hypothetical protein